MFVIKWTRRIYKALSADAGPTAIAIGAALGFIAGSVPLTGALFWLLLLVILVARVQWSAAFAFWFLSRLITWSGGVALYHQVGAALLSLKSLEGFWSVVLDLPGLALLEFDVPAILGGALISTAIAIVGFLPLRRLVARVQSWARGPGRDSKWLRWWTSFWLARLLRYVFIGPAASSESSSTSEES